MRPEIGIIGGGIAGLTAARELTDMGHSVQVFEAQADIGGRIQTTHILGFPVDLGASVYWQSNPHRNTESLYPILQCLPQQHLMQALHDLDSIAVLDKKGQSLNTFFHPTYFDHVHFTSPLYAFYDNAILASRLSTKRAKRPSLADKLLESTRMAELSPQASAQFIRVMKLCFLQEYAAPIETLSILNLQLDSSPKQAYLMMGQYRAFIDRLIQRLSSQTLFSLRCNTPIVSIEQHPTSSKIVLKSKQGQAFPVDRLLLAVPLGVLKKGGIHFFPSLSLEKTRAIDAMVLGQMNNLLLQFEKPFWPLGSKGFVLWDSEQEQVLEYLNLDYFHRQSRACLLLHLYGESALRFKQDSNALQAFVKPLYQTFRKTIPLKYHQHSQFDSNPYILGTGGAFGLSSRPNDRLILNQAEWGNQLFFAGDYCHDRYPGTVEGAYLSGVMASQRLDNSLHPIIKGKKQPRV